MPRIDVQELKTALWQDPRAHALSGLGDDEMRARIEKIANHQILLRPASLIRHRMADLLWNLPHLRPEPRSLVLNHLFQLLALNAEAREEQPLEGSDEASALPPVAPEAAETRKVAAEKENDPTPGADLSSRQASPACSQRKHRPADLFDRLLDWVAALMQ